MRQQLPKAADQRREIYLSKAKEAEEWAVKAHTVFERKAWGQIAQSWHDLADQIDKFQL